MAEVPDLDYILSDCFLAVGQAVGTTKTLDLDVVSWWHQRYHRAFHHAITTGGAVWSTDRRRVTAVGRYLGQRAVETCGPAAVIDLPAASRASDEVEQGCQMRAAREGPSPEQCTDPAAAAFQFRSRSGTRRAPTTGR